MIPLLYSGACLAPSEEQITCDDIPAAAEVDYDQIVDSFVSTGEDGCAGSDCHDSATRAKGLQLDSRALVHEALDTRGDAVYGQLASGEMPEDGEPWSEAELRNLRGWYCYGGFPQ